MTSIKPLIAKYENIAETYREKLSSFANKHELNKLDAVDSFTYMMWKGIVYEASNVVDILKTNSHVIEILEKIEKEIENLKKSKNNKETAWIYGADYLLNTAGEDVIKTFYGNEKTMKGHKTKTPCKYSYLKDAYKHML